MAQRQLKLGAFMRPVSIHTGAWRYPGAWPDANFNFARIKQLIQKLEAGKFDAFFMADHLAVLNMPVNALKRSHTVTSFEPFTLLSALAGATEHIGLIATGSTTFDEPYHVARRFASLDHISGGRAGWNIVTTSNPDAALNFGLDDHMEHAERYKRAREFYDVVTGLWDSFADDAFVRDVDAGPLFRSGENACAQSQGKISVGARAAQHRPPRTGLAADRAGRRVRGRQAARGRNGGSRVHRRRPPRRRAKTLRRHQGPHGEDRPQPRAPEDPARRLCRGRRQRRGSQGKARKARQHGALRQAIASLSVQLGTDASGFDPDGQLPPIPETNASKSGRQRLVDAAARDKLTVRQLAQRVGGYGGLVFVGTPQTIADQMEEWLTSRGSDGFNIMFPFLPAGLDDFVDKVVPELQKRGIFRTEYEGKTLRENLGLPRPKNRFFEG